MKLYVVQWDEDGPTTRKPGEVSTEIKRMTIYYAASSLEQVWNAIEYIRADPEKTLFSIAQGTEALTVLPDTAESEGKP